MSSAEIRQVRVDLGLTQAQMATLMNVHPVTISRWETPAEKKYAPKAYQEALLLRFRDAAQDPTVKAKLGQILLGLGVAAALYFLLKAAFGGADL